MTCGQYGRGRRLLAGTLLAGSACLAWNPLFAGATAPRTLVLTATDVSDVIGAGFHASTGTVPNVEISVSERIPTRRVQHYRIDGYQSTFHRGANQGVTSVSDSVGRYRSVAGARWQYHVLTRLNAIPLGGTRVNTGSLGDQSRGFAVSSPYLSAVAIFVQRGDYTARVDVFQVGAKPIAAALRLAHILDIRMQRAH